MKSQPEQENQKKKILEDMDQDIFSQRIAEHIMMYSKPGRLLWLNLMIGLVRGFGMAIGFTILGAIAIYLLKQLMVLNIPVIGTFIAEIAKIVQTHL